MPILACGDEDREVGRFKSQFGPLLPGQPTPMSQECTMLFLIKDLSAWAVTEL